MKTLKIVMVVLVISLILQFSFAFACSGGGGGGGGETVTDDGSFAGGGAVSWGGHPGYPDVRGSSVWDCNPVGPFREGTAIEDSVQDLIDGYQKGKYTKGDVKNSLAWAEGVGISVNSTQKGQLDSLMNPPPSKNVKKSKDSKVQDKLEKFLDIAVDYYKTKDQNGGEHPTLLQIGAILLKQKFKKKSKKKK